MWNLTNCKLKNNLVGHAGYVNTVTVSPDGSLCASGGKDGVAMLWDLAEGKRLYSLDAGDVIHCLCFSPNRYWLCAATSANIKIWDLERWVGGWADGRAGGQMEMAMRQGGGRTARQRARDRSWGWWEGGRGRRLCRVRWQPPR